MKLKLSNQQIKLIRFGLTRLYYRYFVFLSVLWYTITMRFTKIPSKRVGYYHNSVEIANDMGWGKRYKKDPLNGKLDYLAHPSRLAKNVEDRSPFGDCDDHAIYWCVALLKNKIAERAWFCFYSMEKDNGETSAHAICVFQDHEDMFYWCDYNLPVFLDEYRDKWPYRSAEAFGAQPYAAVMVEVKKVLEDDTPVFGEITVLSL